MPQPRVSMRKILDILRLQAAGLSSRQIAASVALARSTGAKCLQRAALAGAAWSLPDDLDEAALERRLYPPMVAAEPRAPVDFVHVQRELCRAG